MSRASLLHVAFDDDRDVGAGQPRTRRMFLNAARVPLTLQPQAFGLWTIERYPANELVAAIMVGRASYTVLRRMSLKTLHQEKGEVVMEDSRLELLRHMPIWMAAHGRVLVTGLGLGCVVRGLLILPEVTHIDVVEIDPDILRVCGAEFLGNPRVTLHQGDAESYAWPDDTYWDFAWHDLWTDDNALQALHLRLFARFWEVVGAQGAWAFPRPFKRLIRRRFPRERLLF